MKKELTGRVHSFESFGATDGPGIRFIVFMQGCLLKCKYCHNRDTWNINEGNIYTAQEVIEKALRCKPYMEASGDGGITVSGGEPLLQAEFVTELFKLAHENGINTCLDTAGSVKISKQIEELLAETDTVLLDIKHIDNEKCIDLTGMPNTNELEFAKYLSQHGIDTWIRQVLVPGYTDNENDLKKTRKFIDSLENVKRVEVLPYHDLGKHKWIEMGLEYPLDGVNPPSNEQIDKARKILCE